MSNLYNTILKENQLYENTQELHDKIERYFNNLEDGLPSEIDFPTASAYIVQLEKNIKKLMNTSYAGDSAISLWLDDLNAFKLQKTKQECYNKLKNSRTWILSVYNGYASEKGYGTRLTQNQVANFINYITRIDNIEMYKNIIKRLILRQMSSPMLYKTINGVIFNSNDMVENLQFNFNRKPSLNEGFFNPFDEEDTIDEIENVINKNNNVKIPTESLRDHVVKNVKLWDSNRKNKIYIKDGKVYSSRLFVKDDIVEECPIKLISTSSLYTPEIREMAFEVDPEKRLYGIPGGMANYYRNSEDTGIEGNIDYEYDPKEGLIRIYALKKIRPNEELTFQINSEYDYVNGLKKYQFKY